MSIHVALTHRSEYHYDRPVALGPQVVRLRPAPHCRTPILAYSLKVTPANHFINWQQDPQGNFLARLVFPEPTSDFVVEVDLVADMAVINPFDFFMEPDAEHWPFAYDKSLEKELAPFLEQLPLGEKLEAWLAQVPREEIKTIDFLVALNQRLQAEIAYTIRLEPGVQTPEETLTKGSGSCRDTGWLLVQILRRLGIAARFVSGYLIQLAPDVKALDGPTGPTSDFTDLHAWCEAYLPGAGWIGLDPTSGLMAGEGHIPLAATPEPSSAAPIEGLVEKAEVEFSHHMNVIRVAETPRTTRPYSREEWEEIEAIGHKIDARLKDSDVRLTMGGEPTFVSIDDVDGAEWTVDALGPTKRRLAGQLIRRLAKRWTKNPLLHYGQGKWYPGEQLPRWALSAWWRKDGEPVWLNPELLAEDDDHGPLKYPAAEKFAAELAGRLGVADKWMMPAYEDSWYHLWREHRLPSNVDPLKSNLDDPVERARLARIFEQGLGNPVGVVVPLERRGYEWASGPWFLRDERCYLLPGDSPMGLRLPLGSQPWATESDRNWFIPRDPSDVPTTPLPPRFALQRQGKPDDWGVGERLFGEGVGARRRPTTPPPTPLPNRRPQLNESAAWIVRTALCVEPRNGMLHVFMPPLTVTEDYLALVTAIEDTAAALGQPVVIEGYTPPKDARLKNFSVTPDPGVIEVNVPPSESWDELVDKTKSLYEEARLTRLGTEKFMIDGRHVGTGGGNHVTLGGATPHDSPLLRRPDLLKSLLGYWHNHPSLSYLFSGLFIGPTSQHPRVDEAREDATYELELALAQLPAGGQAPPWLVDRVLRHVLTDVTGNTHRAEFCIDKLFSPDSATGRLGILELRAFEMPPHAEMSLAQQVLLRGLVQRFWDNPYNTPLVRWGNRLHDAFMLPHFVWEDLTDVLGDLRSNGLGFKDDWFKPHQEFRFPVIGDGTWRDVNLELRSALEPWHVLGEEPGGGGTVRFVDSSVERVQVKLSNLIEGRHTLAVNGQRVPLTPTGIAGEYVAGVRYRAWLPPSAIHPTIGTHAPLTFDLYDEWSGRAIGGCTYTVAHPGGRNFESFPVNANEAESRRRARYFKHGHTIGQSAPRPSPVNRDFPITLDLRRFY